jgi:hypothetical protein
MQFVENRTFLYSFQNPGNDYSELAKVVRAWPRLRPELKAAIRAIIDTLQ